MKKLLNKLFNITGPNGKSDLADITAIEECFQFKEANSPKDFTKFLSSSVKKYQLKTQHKTELLQAKKNSNDSWKNLLTKKEIKLYLQEPEVLLEPGNIFLTRITTQPKDKNTLSEPAIFIKIDGDNKYILKVAAYNEAITNKLYHVLKIHLNSIVKEYDWSKEINSVRHEHSEMQNELKSTKKTLYDTERALRRKIYEIHNLVEASNEIYSILEFKQLVNAALLTIIGQIGLQESFILLYDHYTRQYSDKYFKGFKEEQVSTVHFSANSEVEKYFIKHRAPQYVKDMVKNEAFSEYAGKLEKIEVICVAPIIYSEKFQGIVGIGKKLYGRDFDQSDYEYFHILINVLSVSIGNSRMYQNMKNLSLTDGMTKLGNYRYFKGRLTEELLRGKRNNTTVSLIILDIDNFKNYNDTLGHQAGDEALKLVGQILKNTVRDEDIVSRYGGEEFCIILPGITKRGIFSMGERIRKSVEKTKFYKEEIQPGKKLTISLGAASFPDDDQEFEGLVKKADEALYQAKRAGKNQLKIYHYL